jgi:hypothetical protein
MRLLKYVIPAFIAAVLIVSAGTGVGVMVSQAGGNDPPPDPGPPPADVTPINAPGGTLLPQSEGSCAISTSQDGKVTLEIVPCDQMPTP